MKTHPLLEAQNSMNHPTGQAAPLDMVTPPAIQLLFQPTPPYTYWPVAKQILEH